MYFCIPLARTPCTVKGYGISLPTFLRKRQESLLQTSPRRLYAPISHLNHLTDIQENWYEKHVIQETHNAEHFNILRSATTP